MGSRSGNYTKPCLTMHQPWASLLVYGIKRVEGRSWPSPIRGRLWIHAASKVPEPETIAAMEDFYREIYAVNGIMDLKFPRHYPVSRLLGCVEVVGCVKREELVCWDEMPEVEYGDGTREKRKQEEGKAEEGREKKKRLRRIRTEGEDKLRCVEVVGCVKREELVCWDEMPEGVRLEGQTDFCWLCEQPQKLLVPFEMRGFQGVYNLERKIFDAAVRGLSPVEGPLSVKFPLPDPCDPFSLKPGSLALRFAGQEQSKLEKPPSFHLAIAGARAAATQFSKKEQSYPSNSNPRSNRLGSAEASGSKNETTDDDRNSLL